MDTSEKYIKMCEKIPRFPLKTYYGEVYLSILWATKDIRGKYRLLSQVDEPVHGNWWPIYRQDQLQEMINNELSSKIEDFYYFCLEETRKDDHWMEDMCDGDINKINGKSMEQLWLAFVMKEEFNKTWDDKKEEWTEL